MTNVPFSERKPRLDSRVVFRSVAGEAIAWSPANAAPMYLDPFTASLVPLLDGDVTLGELVADIVAVFDIPSSQAIDRIDHLLNLLNAYGLLASDPPRDEESVLLDDFLIRPGDS